MATNNFSWNVSMKVYTQHEEKQTKHSTEVNVRRRREEERIEKYMFAELILSNQQKNDQPREGVRNHKKLFFKLKATFHDETFIANACLVHSDLFTVLRERIERRKKQKKRHKVSLLLP